jgi:hypothetical protein
MSSDQNGHSDSICHECHQAKPSETPYRGSVPDEESDDSPFASIKDKIEMGWFYLKSNTPRPIAWMFSSLGWVAVGSVVVSVGLGASYFLVRYLMWGLIVMLGKWLLDRIGRGIPKMIEPTALSMPHSDFGYWEIGMVGVAAVVVAAVVGKLVMHWMKRGAK